MMEKLEALRLEAKPFESDYGRSRMEVKTDDENYLAEYKKVEQELAALSLQTNRDARKLYQSLSSRFASHTEAAYWVEMRDFRKKYWDAHNPAPPYAPPHYYTQ